MIKVYIASKLTYAAKLRQLREEWKVDSIDLHARWFDQAHLETHGNPTPDEFHIHWLVDEEDVKRSDAVIVYGLPEDKLRGALIEAGIAIACGILTIVVGDSPDYGTWQHHPVVAKADSLEHARDMLKKRFL